MAEPSALRTGAAILLTACGLCGASACDASDQGAGDHARPPLTANTPRDAEMIALPEAVSEIGDDRSLSDERPQFEMKIGAFLLDRSPVTVGQFKNFVEETGYVTEAESFGDAAVFTAGVGGWRLVEGASWIRPTGPDGPEASDEFPVTQVSWHDATAFCEAYGARLPTEFEWERTARLGQTPDGTVFRAGEPASMQARLRINTWQGVFPIRDTGEDGYLGVSPVGAFGEAPSGFTDLAGNVWEWTSSPYAAYPVPGANDAPESLERVQRGGSFLCDRNVCEGFRVTARSHSTPDSALMHVGFRCAADLDASSSVGRQIDDRSPELTG